MVNAASTMQLRMTYRWVVVNSLLCGFAGWLIAAVLRYWIGSVWSPPGIPYLRWLAVRIATDSVSSPELAGHLGMIYGVTMLGGLLAIALATGIRLRGWQAAPAASGLLATALLCAPARFIGLFLGAGSQIALVSLSIFVVFLAGKSAEWLTERYAAGKAGECGQANPGGSGGSSN